MISIFIIVNFLRDRKLVFRAVRFLKLFFKFFLANVFFYYICRHIISKSIIITIIN